MPEQWQVKLNDLVESLGQLLETPVRVIEASAVGEDSFSSYIRSALPPKGVFGITWEGLLGQELIEGRPHISASLFLFSQGKRLTVYGDTGGSIELIYEESESGRVGWRSVGWAEDTFGEYAAFSEYVNDDE